MFIAQVAEEVLGPAEKDLMSPWFDEECRALTDSKNKAYRTMINRRTRGTVEDYRKKRQEEKRCHRKKKRLRINTDLEELEKLRSENEARNFFPES